MGGQKKIQKMNGLLSGKIAQFEFRTAPTLLSAVKTMKSRDASVNIVR